MKKVRGYLLPFLFGVGVGSLLVWLILSYRTRIPAANSESVDNNGDSTPDAKYYYDNGVIIKAEHDRNFDGRFDVFEFFEDGTIKKAEMDDNFDGRLDAWLEYEDGNVLISKHDTDKNGIPDLFVHFKYGVINIAIWRPNRASKVARVDIYEDAAKSKTYIDKDGNGLLDTLVIFDEMENEQSTETLMPEVPPENIVHAQLIGRLNN